MKKTVVIGASPNKGRYSHLATIKLAQYGHEVIPLGIKTGEIDGHQIIVGKPDISDVHTITLYIRAQNQLEWYNYILKLKPHRIIFNPGAENDELNTLAQSNGIETREACTLVMLSANLY